MNIGFLLFPGMLQLDFTGPYGVFAQMADTALHLLAKTAEPVGSSDGLAFRPTADFDGAPALDVVVVPGGAGIEALLSDATTLDFLRRRAETCRFTTSVCTGALVLGAAGLLRGRRATTHWQSLDLLSLLGAFPARERVVVDGPIATAAGVTSGIDMALTLVGLLRGDDEARTIQLGMEYSPRPPYDSGSPETAPERVRRALDLRNAKRQEARRAAVLRAARELR